MNPIYKFTLSVDGGTEEQVFPLYRDDLAKEFELQSNQQFYRAKLSGKLTFVRDDFDLINTEDFDAQFGLKIYISYDAGQTWAEYWNGQFWKTDCEFDSDNKNVTVTPTVIDQYANVLAGLEKEYDLIALAPEIVPISLDKRPMLQFYVPGTTVVGCYLSGMWWEQECEATNDFDVLRNTCHFYLSQDNVIAELTQTGTPTLPKSMFGTSPQGQWQNGYTMQSQGYELVITPNGANWLFEIRDVATHTAKWFASRNTSPVPNFTIQLTPVSGSGATGTVEAYIRLFQIFSRLVCDKQTADTYEIDANDIVPNNRNYHYVIQADFNDALILSSNFSTTPTEWGIFQPGVYYQKPYVVVGDLFPIARNWWGSFSLWLNSAGIPAGVDSTYRQPYTLKDAFPIASVISVLLGQIAPEITHQDSTDYSQFLYSESDPLTAISHHLFITPKSNIISLGYDQPAQKAPITLKQVLDMLRDCFRCYWFVDSSNKFRIEHISYFMNGGAYPGTPNFPKIGRYLDREIVTRTGKAWATGASKFRFDKPDMAARYQFGWMDDVTQQFEGNPIDIVSKYVNPENIENIDIALFTSDVDYIMLNQNEISKDGFVLLNAINNSGWKLPYITFGQSILQNGTLSFLYLQVYYQWDMPALNYKIDGVSYVAIGVKKLKTQTLNFPCYADPNPMELIKTFIGNGTIQKLSINLSSRNVNATLKYDTEQ